MREWEKITALISQSLQLVRLDSNKLTPLLNGSIRKEGTRLISLGGPKIGVREKIAVWRQLSSGQLAQGSRVKEFEDAFASWAGLETLIATNSGTSALHIGNLALGIGPGDEVIVPSFSFAASANSIALTGATPVFCDISLDTFTIDPMKIESLITSKTRAIMVVHLYGHMADMPAIMAIANRHNLFVIEDAAQAHGASLNGRPAGGWGDFGAFSFYPTKNMTTGEGGAISTSDSAFDRMCRLLRNQGMIERYKNEVVGLNNRLTEISAAIGLVQLKRIDGFNRQRAANAAYLSESLSGVAGIVPPTVKDGFKHVFHQYTVRVLSRRDDLRQELLRRGVQSSVYYPTPIHKLQAYSAKAELPMSEIAAKECLSLPIHPRLSKRDLARIATKVKESMQAL
jgi:perosamine synthetase